MTIASPTQCGELAEALDGAKATLADSEAALSAATSEAERLAAALAEHEAAAARAREEADNAAADAARAAEAAAAEQEMQGQELDSMRQVGGHTWAGVRKSFVESLAPHLDPIGCTQSNH
jgi:hypothetical protein